MEKDINKMDYVESVAQGCHTGTHDYQRDPTLSTGPRLEIGDGGDTVMILTCTRCNSVHSISAPLGLNDALSTMNSMVDNRSTEKPRLTNHNRPIQSSNIDIDEDEIMKKLGF